MTATVAECGVDLPHRTQTDEAVLMLGQRYDITWCTRCGDVIGQAPTGPVRLQRMQGWHTDGRLVNMDAIGFTAEITDSGVWGSIGGMGKVAGYSLASGAATIPTRQPWYRRLAAWWTK